jgi:GH15 family glucan-1,4-alpha-glucosidase
MKPADGSWSQCRGGKLDQKGREVGAVDSTMGLTLTLEPMGASEALWGLAAAGSLDGLAWLREEGLRSDVAGMRRAEDARFLTDKILVDDWEEFDRAVCLAGLVIRTQTSRGGAILAANDSDTMTHNTLNYTNVWPRDGALVAEALMDAGMGGPALDFVDWCTRVMPQDGLFEQKYQPDGSLGVGWHPLVRDGQRVRPIQLDETALCLSLAARVISRKSPEGQEEMRKKLVEPGLAALLEYRDDRGLPLPSWDLWEERRGVSFYSACTAARALGAWGRSSEAHAMSQGILKFMVGEDGAFVRQLKEDGSQDPDADSALVGGLLQGVFDWELPQVQATLDKVRSRLMDPLPRRDVARYEGDYYHRVADGYPGSPWILCTLWLGQAELRRGNREEGRRLIQTALDLASPTGILSESAHPLTAAPLSVSPLTWSHAEVLRAAAVWRNSAAQG